MALQAQNTSFQLKLLFAILLCQLMNYLQENKKTLGKLKQNKGCKELEHKRKQMISWHIEIVLSKAKTNQATTHPIAIKR